MYYVLHLCYIFVNILWVLRAIYACVLCSCIRIQINLLLLLEDTLFYEQNLTVSRSSFWASYHMSVTHKSAIYQQWSRSTWISISRNLYYKFFLSVKWLVESLTYEKVRFFFLVTIFRFVYLLDMQEFFK